MEPTVSLILTTTGKRPSFAAALRSGLAQDFAALEIVVVDDSPPGSAWTQAEPMAALLADPRVRVVRCTRATGRAATARNTGWAAARGEWLCYLDDDNEYRPGKIRAQHALAVRTGAPVVLCGIEFRAGGRRRTKQVQAAEFRGDELLLGALADTNALFHRRDVQARWDEELGTADDACLFQAILRERNLAVVPNVPEALVVYHAHQGPRVNRSAVWHYRGVRRLVVRWARGYRRETRRIMVCRLLLAAEKQQPGRWGRFGGRAWALLREGGAREWRTVANAAGVKLPGVRRWLIT
jgi:glycosyltransferase involved in cell wall biosynthesis